jgi:hypothetical protein
MSLILILLAIILVTLQAFGVSPARVSLGWLGLAFYMAAGIVNAL